jgi:hypothetical protein
VAARCGLTLSEALDLSMAQLRMMEEGATAIEDRRLRSLAAVIALATAAGMGSEKAADELRKL